MDDNERVDDTLNITDAIRELWDRAANTNPTLTTSQRILLKVEQIEQLQRTFLDGKRKRDEERAKKMDGVKRGLMQAFKAWFD